MAGLSPESAREAHIAPSRSTLIVGIGMLPSGSNDWWSTLGGTLRRPGGLCCNVKVAAVPALPQRTLKVVPAPLIEGVPRAPPVLEEFILILRVQFDGRLIPIFSFCLSPNVGANEPRHWLAD